MKQANTCTISLGDYGNRIVLPLKEGAAVMALLAQAQVVTVEWDGNHDHSLVATGTSIRMDIETAEVLTRGEWEAIKAAVKAEKEAAAARDPE